ncbi:hypothetical protein BC827DRAFT_1158505 [Russula dissimulans]|nr:hypothetical protein BC827DRAFT_1158505 [Russula dissimulans]
MWQARRGRHEGGGCRRGEPGCPQRIRVWRLDPVQIGIGPLVLILLPADKEGTTCCVVRRDRPVRDEKEQLTQRRPLGSTRVCSGPISIRPARSRSPRRSAGIGRERGHEDLDFASSVFLGVRLLVSAAEGCHSAGKGDSIILQRNRKFSKRGISLTGWRGIMFVFGRVVVTISGPSFVVG